MPDVALCNPLVLNHSKLIQNGFENQLPTLFWHFTSDIYKELGIGSQSMENNAGRSSSDTFKELEIGGDSMESTAGSNENYVKDWEEFVFNYSWSCESTLRACSFNYLQFRCCESSALTEELHEKLGKCFVFHILNQKFAGLHGGLVLLVSAERHAVRNFPNAPLERGFVVEISQHSDAPRAHQARDSILIPYGVSALLSIKQKRSRLGQMSKCSDDGADDVEFSMESCKLGCFGRAVEKTCNCSLIGFSKTNQDVQICSPMAIMECYNVDEMEIRIAMNICFEEICTPPCRLDEYLSTQYIFALFCNKISIHAERIT